MKCPLLILGILAHAGEPRFPFQKCMMEMCAWWEETQGECAIKHLERSLSYLELTIEQSLEKRKAKR